MSNSLSSGRLIDNCHLSQGHPSKNMGEVACKDLMGKELSIRGLGRLPSFPSW